MTLAVANAPVSYGSFELTVGIVPGTPDGPTVLARVAEAGYQGIDLGPVGFLGDGAELGARLAAAGLGLAGGYLELPFHDPERLARAHGGLEALLDAFDAAAAASRSAGTPAPRPTLACAGTAKKQASPGRAARQREIGLNDEEWRRLADGLEAAAARCSERGYQASLHNEVGTAVEAPWEIERALELTTVPLCLDTGHLLLGGGDPLRCLHDWIGRINHLHVKSARLDVMRGIVSEGAAVDQVWQRAAFCPLGQGDLDADRLLAGVHQLGYQGWVVVEQDTLPGPGGLQRADADQRSNRDYLRARGF
jgi:inosose dehydratase